MCEGLISAFHMRQNASKLYRLNEFLTKRSLLRNKLRRKFDEEEVSVHPDLELDIVNKPWKRRKVGFGDVEGLLDLGVCLLIDIDPCTCLELKTCLSSRAMKDCSIF